MDRLTPPLLQPLQQLYLTCVIQVMCSDTADQASVAEFAASRYPIQITAGQPGDFGAKGAV